MDTQSWIEACPVATPVASDPAQEGMQNAVVEMVQLAGHPRYRGLLEHFQPQR